MEWIKIQAVRYLRLMKFNSVELMEEFKRGRTEEDMEEIRTAAANISLNEVDLNKSGK